MGPARQPWETPPQVKKESSGARGCRCEQGESWILIKIKESYRASGRCRRPKEERPEAGKPETQYGVNTEESESEGSILSRDRKPGGGRDESRENVSLENEGSATIKGEGLMCSKCLPKRGERACGETYSCQRPSKGGHAPAESLEPEDTGAQEDQGRRPDESRHALVGGQELGPVKWRESESPRPERSGHASEEGREPGRDGSGTGDPRAREAWARPSMVLGAEGRGAPRMEQK